MITMRKIALFLGLTFLMPTYQTHAMHQISPEFQNLVQITLWEATQRNNIQAMNQAVRDISADTTTKAFAKHLYLSGKIYDFFGSLHTMVQTNSQDLPGILRYINYLLIARYNDGIVDCINTDQELKNLNEIINNQTELVILFSRLLIALENQRDSCSILRNIRKALLLKGNIQHSVIMRRMQRDIPFAKHLTEKLTNQDGHSIEYFAVSQSNTPLIKFLIENKLSLETCLFLKAFNSDVEIQIIENLIHIVAGIIKKPAFIVAQQVCRWGIPCKYLTDFHAIFWDLSTKSALSTEEKETVQRIAGQFNILHIYLNPLVINSQRNPTVNSYLANFFNTDSLCPDAVARMIREDSLFTIPPSTEPFTLEQYYDERFLETQFSDLDRSDTSDNESVFSSEQPTTATSRNTLYRPLTTAEILLNMSLYEGCHPLVHFAVLLTEHEESSKSGNFVKTSKITECIHFLLRNGSSVVNIYHLYRNGEIYLSPETREIFRPYVERLGGTI